MSDRAVMLILGMLVVCSTGFFVIIGYIVYHFVWKYW